MKYTQLLPPDYLADYVQYFWTLESDEADALPKTFAPVADGCPGIIFQHSEKGTFYNQDHDRLPSLFLYGQTIKPIQLHFSGQFRTLGVFFHPTALHSVFGFRADELTDACLDLNGLSQPQGSSLTDQLENAVSLEAQMERLSAYVFSQINQNRVATDPTTQYALARIRRANGSLPLKELLGYVQLSERSLERKFKQGVGISPKLFSKICRFQASLHQLRTNTYDQLSDIAFDNGYADQSHFIRTFKELSGFSPYQYQKRSSEVVRNFPHLIT